MLGRLKKNSELGETSIWAKRMLSHDITEFYQILDVYSTFISS